MDGTTKGPREVILYGRPVTSWKVVTEGRVDVKVEGKTKMKNLKSLELSVAKRRSDLGRSSTLDFVSSFRVYLRGMEEGMDIRRTDRFPSHLFHPLPSSSTGWLRIKEESLHGWWSE